MKNKNVVATFLVIISPFSIENLRCDVAKISPFIRFFAEDGSCDADLLASPPELILIPKLRIFENCGHGSLVQVTKLRLSGL